MRTASPERPEVSGPTLAPAGSRDEGLAFSGGREEVGRGTRRLHEVVSAAIEPFAVAAGETVLRQGEEGRHLYLVASGALDVVVTAEGGLRLPVGRLGPGSHFGEMSLLTGTPVSADVVGSESSLLYAVTAAQFDQLVRQDRELMEYLAVELGHRLKRMDEHLAALQQRQSSMSKLLGYRPAYPFKSDLPRLEKTISGTVEKASQSSCPLLLTGEPGVGKRSLAQYLPRGCFCSTEGRRKLPLDRSRRLTGPVSRHPNHHRHLRLFSPERGPARRRQNTGAGGAAVKVVNCPTLGVREPVPPRRTILNLLVLAVAAHSIAVGVCLLSFPVWTLKLVGWQYHGEVFWPSQAGLFLIILGVAYAAAVRFPPLLWLLIVSKASAFVFLMAHALWLEAPRLTVLLGVFDGLMGLAVAAGRWWVDREAR